MITFYNVLEFATALGLVACAYCVVLFWRLRDLRLDFDDLHERLLLLEQHTVDPEDDVS